MNEPVSFESKTARFGLPFLFAAQAQKEFFINEAHALVDALLHPVVDGIASAPPEQPSNGACWIVADNPSAEWVGHADQIACFQSGSWLFATPTQGMRVFNRSSGIEMRFMQEWRSAEAILPPTGGTTVDSEARAAVAELIDALQANGLLRQL